MNDHDKAPLLRGGQGRSDDSVMSDAETLAWTIGLGVLAVAAFALLGWIAAGRGWAI